MTSAIRSNGNRECSFVWRAIQDVLMETEITLRVFNIEDVLNVSHLRSSTTVSCPSRSLADKATWRSKEHGTHNAH